MTARRPRHPERDASSVPRTSAVADAVLWLVILVTAALVVFVRIRLAEVPLERDEGEYAYAGQLILDGVPPYALAYNMKFPGTYYAYAVIMAAFGESAWGIRFGLVLVNLATAALLLLWARRLFGPVVAAITTSGFLLLAIDRWVMGGFGHATHFVLLPWMASLLMLEHGRAGGRALRFVVAGALAGLAVCMKQHAVFLAALAVVLAFMEAPPGARWRRAAWVMLGGAVTAAVVTGVLAASGVLGRFWFWTFQYGAEYISQVPLSGAADSFLFGWDLITRASAVFWYVAALGLVLLFVDRRFGLNAVAKWTTVGWLGAAALSIAPGFYFREHYFILLLPVVALLAGIAIGGIEMRLVDKIGTGSARLAAIAAFAALASVYVYRESDYFFSMSPAEVSRATHSTNPFLESPEIARYIREHTSPDDRVLILGSEPQIPFYADRRSATGYIYMYGLMESHRFAERMQEEMIREAEAAQAKYLVFVAVSMSWLATPGAGERVLTWAREFTARCYDRVGAADVHPDPVLRMRWDSDSLSFRPRSPFQVLTFKRRDTCG
jgi:hypothetical protein